MQTDLYAPDMAWEPIETLGVAAEAKVLRDAGEGKERTMLVRLRAGDRITPRSHVAAMQHDIVEGEYEAGGKTCRAGTYRLLPAHADVEEIATESGMMLLMIYDAVVDL